MNRQFPNDPGKGFVDRAEQAAQDFSRIVTVVEVIADRVQVLLKVVSRLVAGAKATLTRPPANVQVLGSTERVRQGITLRARRSGGEPIRDR